MNELSTLTQAIAEDLGDRDTWPAPVEFRDSLALCALNSAYSLRGTSAAAERVLDRYRSIRPTASTDSGPDLLQAVDDAGGPEAFAVDVLHNRSRLPGTKRLRTEGIYEALSRMAAPDIAVTTAQQLRDATNREAVSSAWKSAKGLGPLSWAYVLMNAGVGDETKPDVMVRRYIARVLGSGEQITADRSRMLLTAAADAIGVELRALDRAIWAHESSSRI